MLRVCEILIWDFGETFPLSCRTVGVGVPNGDVERSSSTRQPASCLTYRDTVNLRQRGGGACWVEGREIVIHGVENINETLWKLKHG